MIVPCVRENRKRTGRRTEKRRIGPWRKCQTMHDTDVMIMLIIMHCGVYVLMVMKSNWLCFTFMCNISDNMTAQTSLACCKRYELDATGTECNLVQKTFIS